MRHGSWCHVGPRSRERGGRTHRRRGEARRRPLHAGSGGEPRPLPARRPRFRVLLGGSAPDGGTRSGVRARDAVAGRRGLPEALRRERRRGAPNYGQLRRGRADAARGLPAPVRGRGPGRRLVDDGGLQPREWDSLHREPRPRRRRAARRVGLGRRSGVGLACDARHGRRGGGRPGSRDARASAPLRTSVGYGRPSR